MVGAGGMANVAPLPVAVGDAGRGNRRHRRAERRAPANDGRQIRHCRALQRLPPASRAGETRRGLRDHAAAVPPQPGRGPAGAGRSRLRGKAARPHHLPDRGARVVRGAPRSAHHGRLQPPLQRNAAPLPRGDHRARAAAPVPRRVPQVRGKTRRLRLRPRRRFAPHDRHRPLGGHHALDGGRRGRVGRRRQPRGGHAVREQPQRHRHVQHRLRGHPHGLAPIRPAGPLLRDARAGRLGLRRRPVAGHDSIATAPPRANRSTPRRSAVGRR